MKTLVLALCQCFILLTAGAYTTLAGAGKVTSGAPEEVIWIASPLLQVPSAGDTTKPAQPVTPTRRPLPVDTPPEGQNSRTRPGIFRQPSKGPGPATSTSPTPRSMLDLDAVVELNLCAGRDGTAMSFFTKTNRKWNYFKRSETARMIISGINAERQTVTVNTIGLVEDFVVERSPLSLLSLPAAEQSDENDPSESTTPPPSQTEEQRKKIEQEIQQNLTLISNYVLFLQEKRRTLVAQECIPPAELDSWLTAPVPGTSYNRWQLQTNLQDAIRTLSAQDPLRVKANEQREALRDELDRWALLRGGTLVAGPAILARDKDYIRFEVKRKNLLTDTEETLPPYDFPVYGNFRINVSTGLIFNGLVNHSYLAVTEDLALPDQDASKRSDPLKKVPVRENTPLITLGLGALVHFYHTLHWVRGSLAPALSVGASLNAYGKYSGMLGGSLIIGSRQRLVLTAGGALGQVERLQKPYEEGKPYAFTDAEFPMTSETKGSWFVGITWNLSSNRNPVAH